MDVRQPIKKQVLSERYFRYQPTPKEEIKENDHLDGYTNAIFSKCLESLATETDHNPICRSTGATKAYARVPTRRQQLSAFQSNPVQTAQQRRPIRQTSHRQEWRISVGLDPSETSVLVVGGGGVAMKTAERLTAASCTVYVLQRSDIRREEIEQIGAKIIRSDVLDADSVSEAFQGIDALDVVVTSVGGTPADPTADSDGNINLIDSAMKTDVKKFILVSSIGVGDSKMATPQTIYEALEPVLIAKGKAEERLKECAGKMEYVVIRPGGLRNEPKTGNGILTADTSICGSIHREDVAELVYRCIFSSRTKDIVLSAVDRDQLMGDPREFVVYEP